MHGAGNDFVLLDLRGNATVPNVDTLRLLADRHHGIGCDQVLGITDSARSDCIAGYRIWNADGSIAQQCGNGARCVAAWLRQRDALAATRFSLDSPAGVISVELFDDDSIAVDMGVPDFAPSRIPLRGFDEAARYALDLDGDTVEFGAVSMGNPHALITVDDVRAAPAARIGAALQSHTAFPERVNVGFAQILAPGAIRLRVFERGVGETLACGSGACAAVAIGVRQGLIGRNVQVDLPGGILTVNWPADDAPIRLRGPATFVFDGDWLQ